MQQEATDTAALMENSLWSRRKVVKTEGKWTVEGYVDSPQNVHGS